MTPKLLSQLLEIMNGADEGTVSRAAVVDLAADCAEAIRQLEVELFMARQQLQLMQALRLITAAMKSGTVRGQSETTILN